MHGGPEFHFSWLCCSQLQIQKDALHFKSILIFGVFCMFSGNEWDVDLGLLNTNVYQIILIFEPFSSLKSPMYQDFLKDATFLLFRRLFCRWSNL